MNRRCRSIDRRDDLVPAFLVVDPEVDVRTGNCSWERTVGNQPSGRRGRGHRGRVHYDGRCERHERTRGSRHDRRAAEETLVVAENTNLKGVLAGRVGDDKRAVCRGSDEPGKRGGEWCPRITKQSISKEPVSVKGAHEGSAERSSRIVGDDARNARICHDCSRRARSVLAAAVSTTEPKAIERARD